MRMTRLRPLLLPGGTLLVLTLFFLLTPLVSPYSPTIPTLVEITQPPSWVHPFGTDGLGRDLMTRLAVAGQGSAFVALLAAIIVMLLALIAASITSVSGPRVAGLIHGLIDVFLTLPPLLVILTVAALKGGGGPVTVAIILGTFGWMQAARAAIEESAAVAASEFVTFARRAGMGRIRALVRHIIPGISGSASATFGTAFASALLGEATLSFLGFGVSPPAPSLGRMIGEAGVAMLDHWWLATFPGAVVLLLAASVGALGERLRRLLDPLAAMHSRAAGVRVAPVESAIPGGASAGLDRGGEEPVTEGLFIDGLEVSVTGAGGLQKDLLFLPQPLHIPKGRVLAVVGSSGAGKSSLSRALSGLLPASVRVAGSVQVDGAAPVRGDIAFVPQDPYGAFLPGRRIGWHFRSLPLETDHPGSMYDHPDARAVRWLERVGIKDPDTALRQEAATMSGGELQRVAIALALASGPKALVADEPTSSLDTVASREIMALLRDVCTEERLPLVVASHDIALVCEYADLLLAIDDGTARGPVTPIESGGPKDAAVKAGAGKLVEAAEALWMRAPAGGAGKGVGPGRLGIPGRRPVLHAHDLSVSFNEQVIVHDMEVQLFPGELVLMVGRSGVGKTTTLKVLDGWLPPTMGTVEGAASVMVPQNAARSIDPRLRVRSVIKEAARHARRSPSQGRNEAPVMDSVTDSVTAPAMTQVMTPAMTPEEAALAVGLDPRLLEARALTLSGGESRRLAIARGLVTGASVILLDEPLSGLDPVAQLEMMKMLRALTTEEGRAILMVSHDIQAAASCDRIIVMSAGYAPGTAGTTVEDGAADQVLAAPKHSATRGLIEAAARL